MPAAQDSRADFEDGAWYWVEKEGCIGDPPTVAPAMYKAECDAWYSFKFSGIPTRHLKVLEPCRRAALSAEPVSVPHGWKLVQCDPDAAMKLAAQRADMDHSSHKDWLEDEWPDFLRVWKAMLASSPQPPAALVPLTGEAAHGIAQENKQ